MAAAPLCVSNPCRLCEDGRMRAGSSVGHGPRPMEWDALEHLAKQGFQGAKPRLLCRCAAEK